MRDTPPNMIGESFRLLRPFWPIATFATAMGVISGLTTAWLLAMINRAFQGNEPLMGLLVSFGGLIILRTAGEIISNLGNVSVGQQIVAGLRKDLTDRVLSAPIDRIERFRVHRLIAALNQDVDMISAFTFSFSSLAIAASVTAGCMVYLVILSAPLFLVAIVAILAGVALNTYARRRGARGFEAARSAQDDLQKHYRAVTEGAKELRINRVRRASVHKTQLGATIDLIRDLRLRSMRIYMTANALSSSLFFVIIGVMIAMQFGLGVDPNVLSGFVLVLLFVKGPISQLVGSLPLFTQAEVSLRRVTELASELANPEPHLLLDDTPAPACDVASITFDAVQYAFPAPNGGGPFVLGPIDLTIPAGEILFIVGENGSGKTTLLKLILGLYAPQQGAVLLNGAPVTSEMRDDYRQLFSAVFFDYFLFDELVTPAGSVPAVVTGYLEKLEIAHKVAVVDGRFTTTDLSAGQRKRLALIHAYLEDRQIIVFDEWAAEQDPTFRRLFYDELLPDLKAQGKTLIVISHDDRYFGAADRVLRLENGRIVELAASAKDEPVRMNRSSM